MTTGTLGYLLFLPLLAGGLLVPGWLLGRALRTPAGAVGALLGSAALLMNLILALDALDVPLTGAHIAAGLAVLCALLGIVTGCRPSANPVAPRLTARNFRWQRHHWFLLPAALGLGAIALQASLEPLSGFDTAFRWDFLARQMLRQGNLHFYPPIRADDFLLYGWCDGIAPLVSSLYFWAYLSLGQVAAWATTPIVIGQALLLFWAVYQLAARRANAAAGCAAAAILATSGVLLWGVAMGQETGLTALSLIAMFLFIERHRDDPSAHWLVWAGVAAGTGALAREYGLAFAALGGLALAWQRVPRRGWLEFALTVAVVALPWFARNWLKTGNPLYSYALGGLFPANPVSAEYYRIVGQVHGLGADASPLSGLAILLGSLAGIPLALGCAGAVALRRQSGPWLVAIACVVALWLWSVGQTSGGYAYSLRVLTPALALGAVLGGALLGRWAAARRGGILCGLLTVLAIDAGARSLYLPIDPLVAWWRPSTPSWRDFGRNAARWSANPNWAALADAADGRKIFVSDPFFHALLVARGAKPVPLFSPAVRFLFEPDTNFSTCLARLRDQQMRFVMVARHNDVNDRQLALHPFFQRLQSARPVVTASLYFVYDLYSPELGGTIPIVAPPPPVHAP
jgi:Dolichyl-phosphate-mannose-protein mannosyltransferase